MAQVPARTEEKMTLFKKKESIDRSELLFSGKALVKMMIPLMLQQMLNMTVGVVNSIMVSKAGERFSPGQDARATSSPTMAS